MTEFTFTTRKLSELSGTEVSYNEIANTKSKKAIFKDFIKFAIKLIL